MSEIIQTLGFNAGSAIAELQRLDGAMAQLQGTTQSMAGAFRQFNAGNVSKQFGTLTASSNATANSVQSNVTRMTTSLGLLSRIVFTQAVVRGLSTMRNAMKATAGDAADFQRSISLITTIDDSGQSVDKLSDSVRNLSDQFNIPLLEASAGVYQAISNQVGDAAESLEFAAKSAEFAKATNSSLASSVDLLSGVLKSYQLEVSETSRISSVFFKAVDLGRINANELANSFGRIGPRAADMGISLEESGAALSALTVRGLKTNEAITQLSGIMTGLAKPSDAMKDAFKALGVESGEAAIRSFGLFGTLEKLRAVSGGSASAMSKLFGNVRALSGATSLLGDGLASATSNLNEMNAAGADFAHQKYLQAIANDGERVRKEFNEIKNLFVTEVGGALLQASKQFLETTNATTVLGNAIKVTTPAVDSIALGLGALALQLASSKAGVLGLAKAFNVLGGAVLAAGVGDILGTAIGDKLRDSRDAEINALTDANKQEIEAFKSKEQEKLRIARDAAKSRIAQDQEFTRALLGSSQADIAKALNANDRVTALEGVIGRQIESLQEFLKVSEAAEKAAFDLQRSLAQGSVAGQQSSALKGEIDKLLGELQQRINEGADRVIEGSASAAINGKLQGLLDKLKGLQQDGQLTADNLRDAALQGERIQESVGQANDILNSAGRAFNPALEDASKIVERFQALLQLPPPQPVDTAALSALEQVLAQQPGAQFGSMNSALQSSVPATAQIAANMERAAAAAQRAAAASRAPVNRAFGGMTHLAAGGAARGIDTIPAMLSPGEFVMNARSSRKFYSQLQAMNAGQSPAYRENGGSVTNDNSTTIGDVHVQTNAANVKDLMRDMERHVRRGTGRLG